MKVRNLALAALLGCAMLGAPTLAISAHAQSSQAEFERYLAKHPNVRAHPELMNDPQWLRDHPNFAEFRGTHPNVAREARAMGDYDSRHVWRDRNWWVQNDRTWAYKHHKDWFDHDNGHHDNH